MTALAMVPASKGKLTVFRDKAHTITDQWVDSLAPALLGDKPLTMEEISALFEERKADLLSALVTDFIGVHHQEVLEQQFASCPKCKKSCKRRRQTDRRVESRQGSSRVHYDFVPKKTLRS